MNYHNRVLRTVQNTGEEATVDGRPFKVLPDVRYFVPARVVPVSRSEGAYRSAHSSLTDCATHGRQLNSIIDILKTRPYGAEFLRFPPTMEPSGFTSVHWVATPSRDLLTISYADEVHPQELMDNIWTLQVMSGLVSTALGVRSAGVRLHIGLLWVASDCLRDSTMYSIFPEYRTEDIRKWSSVLIDQCREDNYTDVFGMVRTDNDV
jgi:hypothetical protein